MNGLLVRHAEIWKNIGDYIQSAAQEQYWDHVDIIVDREHTDTTTSPIPGEKINLIMNSWWMWHPECFPPSKDINPLFVSFHISPHVKEDMLTSASVEYLKKYQPIGARDVGTMRILEEHGIKSYFSGCLTLTLGRSYLYNGPRKKVYFTDPEYKLFKPRAFKEWGRAVFNLIRWRKKVNLLSSRFIFDKKTTFSKISKKLNHKICTTLFYDEYRKYFSDDILLNAEYLTHIVNVQRDYPSDEACMDLAHSLIKGYASARLVVTSRIHAALPCLGLETPVVFVRSWRLDSGDIKGRLEGLIDLFNYQLEVTDNEIKPATNDMAELTQKGPITHFSSLKNADTYVPYRDALIKRAEAFVDSIALENNI